MIISMFIDSQFNNLYSLMVFVKADNKGALPEFKKFRYFHSIMAPLSHHCQILGFLVVYEKTQLVGSQKRILSNMSAKCHTLKGVIAFRSSLQRIFGSNEQKTKNASHPYTRRGASLLVLDRCLGVC